ncbi:MAG: fumarate reductase subunit D [Chloroflexi bacterium]|nr:fumarate reductase subunit D [Chloroflexota bacterium]
MRPSNEPFFWAIFSAGGMIVAFLLPVLVIITGFLVPAEVVEFRQLDNLFGNWLVRLVVFGVAFFSFFHAAHRIRHTLKDVGLRRIATPLAVVCYLAALAGTVWAAIVVL